MKKIKSFITFDSMFSQTRTYNPSTFFIKTCAGQPESGKKVVQMFISVDPMADKYPGISGYTYCANNPLKYLDPDGRQVIITGDEASTSKAVEQMQSKTSNLSFSRDPKTGLISATGKAKTKEEKYMMNIIKDDKISVNICAENDYTAENGLPHAGGAFMGNQVFEKDGEISGVNAYQEVNPEALAKYDKDTKMPKGNFIWHEIAEAFEGGKIAMKKGSTPADLGSLYFKVYNKAHYNAGKYFPGTIHSEKISGELPDFRYPMLQLTIPVSYIKKSATR